MPTDADNSLSFRKYTRCPKWTLNRPTMLKPAQIRALRAKAHALKPVILLGQKGFTEAVAKELDSALDHHELVKIKLAAPDKPARQVQLDQIQKAAKAEVVQFIGGTATLFRRNAEHPVIKLPAK